MKTASFVNMYLFSFGKLTKVFEIKITTEAEAHDVKYVSHDTNLYIYLIIHKVYITTILNLFQNFTLSGGFS